MKPQKENSSQIGDEDPVESLLKKAGCLERHYQVQV